MNLQEHFDKELDYIYRSNCHQLFTPEGCLYCSVELQPRECPINFGRGICYPQFSRRVIRFDGVIDGKSYLGTVVVDLSRSTTATAESSW
jgi:hypothetical protein